MENKFEFNPAKIKVNMEDVTLLGKFLTEKRLLLNKQKSTEKLLKQIVSEIDVNVSTLLHWETGEVIPSEDKLPRIAQVYGIDLEELKKVFEISKAARQREKDARFNPKRKISLKRDGIWGDGGSSGCRIEKR